MLITEQHLDLQFPRHWNLCTNQQLEQIACAFQEAVERANVFRPFSITDVKMSLFFLWGGIKIEEPINPRVKVEEQYYVCSHPKIEGTFHLYLWQIDYWINGLIDYEREAGCKSEGAKALVKKKVKGQFDWLDDPNDYGLTRMPYGVLKLKKYHDDWKSFLPFHRVKSFHAPGALMENFSWQQYRFAQELMDNYIKQSNNLLNMQRHRVQYSDEQIFKQYKNEDIAKAMFLACIFDGKIKYIDTETQRAVVDYHYSANQYSDNAQYFRNFPNEKWQVILFWWSGMMKYLSKQFPHVFSKGNVKHTSPKNPLEVYTATIATLEKYLKQTEDELNRKKYILTLETLERMAKENEEMEKLNRKHK